MKKYCWIILLVIVSMFALVACGEQPSEEKKDDSKEVTTIVINNKAEMFVGESEKLDITVQNGNAADCILNSSDEEVVKFEDGALVAVGVGTSTISVILGSVKTELTITVKEIVKTSYSISFELNGGSCEGLPTDRTEDDVIDLVNPTKDGSSFDGWYVNADFSGEKVTALNKDNLTITKLYAKWTEKTYKVVYNFTDANGKTTTEEVVVEFSKAYTLVEKKASSNEVFSGWFKENTLLNEVSAFAASSVNEEVVNVYGKMVSASSKFNVTLEYNGGSTIYSTYDDMVADFLADYNYVNGKSYSAIRQIGITATGPVTFDTFYTAKNEEGDKCSEKWGWLYKYVYDLSVKKLSSDSYVVTGLKNLLNGKSLTADQKKGISCGIRAFLMGMRIGTEKTQSVDFSKYPEKNGFWSYLSKGETAQLTVSAVNSLLPSPEKENFTFLGWYKDAELTQGPVKNVINNCKLYAKFDENVKVEEVALTMKTANVLKFKTMQLEWTISPSNASVRDIVFTSSNPEVATITEEGLITAVDSGKTIIRIASKSETGKYDEYELQVYTPDYVRATYDTVSYVTVGETIKLNAIPQGLDSDSKKIVWTSADETIATVDNGVVTGVKDGFVNIRATIEGTTSSYFDFGVTVLDKNASAIKKFIASANVGNVFFRYDLGVGAGTPSYYKDIIGSVSKLLFNTPYELNRSYEAAANKMDTNSGKKTSTEFITVHYTGNMNANTNGLMHAKYFVSSGVQVSIHYITGNDGIYHMLNDDMIAWHAGDGTGVKFAWYPTGVMAQANDPQYPVFGISNNSKFTINGQETTVDVPTGTTPETAKVTGDTFMCDGVENKCINDMGLSFKIVDGQYYMGTTYWCYSQVDCGRICNHGGNNNSIGIESCVDKGSDLWYTWQTTARLCAHLMQENNLDITRVVGHHFFSAKDCPQPMLENELEIWYEFKKLVAAEYELLTNFSNYEITMEVNGTQTNVANTGRVTVQDGTKTQSVNYTVTMKNKTTGVSETITLGSIIQGTYDE